MWAHQRQRYLRVVCSALYLRSNSCDGLAQGVTLVLETCCQLQHQPGEALLEALAAAMRMALPAFKRLELASCLDAFKALAFHPGNELMQVSWHGMRLCLLLLPATTCLPEAPVYSEGVEERLTGSSGEGEAAGGAG